MKIKLMVAVVICSTLKLWAQDENPLHRLRMDEQEKREYLQEIIYDFIAVTTEMEFIEKHFKVNDSIEFPIHLEVDKNGRILPEKTKVTTQFDFFNRHFEQLLNKLPRFEESFSDFELDGVPQFTITPQKKLKSLFVRTGFHRPKANTFKTPAVFPGCDATKSAANCKAVFQEKSRNMCSNT